MRKFIATQFKNKPLKVNFYGMDFKYSKESKQMLLVLDRYLLKNWGKRCKTKGQGCGVCEIYAIRDLFAIFIN